ncbi:MAG: class I SAM-dependent methyltransferase [Oscillospiraceae bacterium]|nr:class I SAM-dependent methyltransferase [Oscillospiraceae bacterium]
MDKQTVIQFFNKMAPQWDTHTIHNDSVIGKILDHAGIITGTRVLDIGCGTGVLFPDYLARGVKSVTGVDISPAMVAAAKAKFSDPRITLLLADAETLHFPGAFDCCVIYNALPHFPDPKRLIEHLSLQLKPGGRLTVAHGASRDAINHRHRAINAELISHELPPAQGLAKLFAPAITVDTVISNEKTYIVSGTTAK